MGLCGKMCQFSYLLVYDGGGKNDMTKTERIKEVDGKSIIFTSNILSAIYNLKTSNEKSFNNGICDMSVKVNATEAFIGICNENMCMHIMNDEEMLITEILLSWSTLVEQNNNYSEILFNDIDCIRSRNKGNRVRINLKHEKYLEIFELFNRLYFVYTGKSNEIDSSEIKHKLFNYELVNKKDKPIGIKYNFGKLEYLLKASKQIAIVETNVFDIRMSEMMNYKILRYLVSSIFMNRIKGNSFSRTHKSILNSMTCNDNGEISSYYDSYSKSHNISKYLSRYLERLCKVLELLKQCNYISNYSVEKIDSRLQLVTGCGKVTIIVKKYKKKRKVVHTCP